MVSYSCYEISISHMIPLHSPGFGDLIYSHANVYVFYVIPNLLQLMTFKSETAENREIYGTVGGTFTTVSLTRAQKVWRILPALGDIAFAFPFTPLVIEIQVYLKF